MQIIPAWNLDKTAIFVASEGRFSSLNGKLQIKMKHTNWKRLSLKRYDRILMALFGLLLGLTVSSCEDPDEPVPEYGVQPMYGVPTAVVDQQKPL